MEFQGTKGEWFACCLEDKPHYLFSKEGEVTICGFYKIQDDGNELPIEEVRANALLISKAPEMLEMLNKLLEHYEDVLKGDFSSFSLRSEIDNTRQLIKEVTTI